LLPTTIQCIEIILFDANVQFYMQ